MLPRTPRPAAASTVASDAARGMAALPGGASSSVQVRPGASSAVIAVPDVTTNGLPDPSSAQPVPQPLVGPSRRRPLAWSWTSRG